MTSQKARETLFTPIEAGEVRGMRKGALVYLAYFLAHDAHQRGNILLSLKECGQPVNKDVRFTIWDGDRR